MYYQGIYAGPYRGGFFDSLGKIAKVGIGLATGGLGGAAVGLASAFAGGGKPKTQTPAAGYAIPGIPQIRINPPGFGPPGAGITVGPAAAIAGGCPQGYHLDKKTRTRCVRNRRMNPLNPRAARRSVSRLKGFERMARRVVTFTSSKPVKRGRFKKGR